MNYFQQETTRIQLRKASVEDIKDWEEFFVDNPNLRFLAITKNDDSEIPDLSAKWIAIQLERYEETGFGHLIAVDKETNVIIGCAGILQKELEGEIVYEIAYSIKPRFWRQGYATELALHLKAFATEHQVSPEVISIIHKENIGSQKVAYANGMTILRETIYRDIPVYIFGARIGNA